MPPQIGPDGHLLTLVPMFPCDGFNLLMVLFSLLCVADLPAIENHPATCRPGPLPHAEVHADCPD